MAPNPPQTRTGSMSQLGQQRTCRAQNFEVCLLLKAEIVRQLFDVNFGPTPVELMHRHERQKWAFADS
jgi:hypothetical protein